MEGQSSTHGVELRARTVIKRFRSWDRGEAEREWRALTLLARYAPGLAPVPISSQLHAEPPAVVMSRLPGSPLRGTKIGEMETAALAAALAELQTAVPLEVLRDIPPCPWNIEAAFAKAQKWCEDRPSLGGDPVIAHAYSAGTQWLSLARFEERSWSSIFGLSDGNLANYLWDGSRVRVLDFEDSGRSNRVFELAEIVEHPSCWVDTEFDSGSLLGHFDLSVQEVTELREVRRLLSLLWFMMFLPGRPGHLRNPAGTLEAQAGRLLDLLG
ncbi:phosphotransferase [Streptomyces griseoincarnatus]